MLVSEFKEDLTFVLFSSELLKKIKTNSPIKATIKEENNITYLNASCRSITDADSISVVSIIEKINTPIRLEKTSICSVQLS